MHHGKAVHLNAPPHSLTLTHTHTHTHTHTLLFTLLLTSSCISICSWKLTSVWRGRGVGWESNCLSAIIYKRNESKNNDKKMKNGRPSSWDASRQRTRHNDVALCALYASAALGGKLLSVLPEWRQTRSPYARHNHSPGLAAIMAD